MDHVSVELIIAKSRLKAKLGIVQNEATGTVLGTPRFTKVLNLCIEANLLDS